MTVTAPIGGFTHVSGSVIDLHLDVLATLSLSSIRSISFSISFSRRPRASRTSQSFGLQAGLSCDADHAMEPPYVSGHRSLSGAPPSNLNHFRYSR